MSEKTTEITPISVKSVSVSTTSFTNEFGTSRKALATTTDNKMVPFILFGQMSGTGKGTLVPVMKEGKPRLNKDGQPCYEFWEDQSDIVSAKARVYGGAKLTEVE